MNRTNLFLLYHKHIKSGAPPDKVGVPHLQLPTEFRDFNSRIDFYKGYQPLVPDLILVF